MIVLFKQAIAHIEQRIRPTFIPEEKPLHVQDIGPLHADRIGVGFISADRIKTYPETMELPTEPIEAPRVDDDHQFFKRDRSLLFIDIAIALAVIAVGGVGFMLGTLV